MNVVNMKLLSVIPMAAVALVAFAPAASAETVNLSAAGYSAGAFFADKTEGKPVSGVVIAPNGTQTFYVDSTGFWIQYGSPSNPKSGPKETCLFNAKGKVSKCTLKQGSQVMDNTSANKSKTERSVKMAMVAASVNSVLQSPSGNTVADAVKTPKGVTVTATDPSDPAFAGKATVSATAVKSESNVGNAAIKVAKPQKVKL